MSHGLLTSKHYKSDCYIMGAIWLEQNGFQETFLIVSVSHPLFSLACAYMCTVLNIGGVSIGSF